MKSGVVEKVRAAGGEVYGISSEPQALAGRARVDWKLDFETIGDPHHEIAGACRDRGWVDLFVNSRMEFLEQSVGDRFDWKPTHPKGFFQPGVLALGSDDRVLYRWRGVPTHQNMGGATERPTAEHVLRHVEAALSGSSQGSSEDAPLDRDPVLDSRGIPWPIFASLLVANGWFLNARGFQSARHVLGAAGRLLAFLLAWGVAFATLPTLPVAAALAAWVAYITPKVRWVGREFQDVSGEAS